MGDDHAYSNLLRLTAGTEAVQSRVWEEELCETEDGAERLRTGVCVSVPWECDGEGG